MDNRQKKFWFLAGLILLAALSRLLPHPYNFTPLGAVALFGAAFFTDKKWAILVPLFAMWISDLMLNNVFYSAFHSGFTFATMNMAWVYGSLILIAILGFKLLKKVTLPRVVGGALSASVIFFLVTNFGVWISGSIYPISLQGLIPCYTAPIPFFHYTVAGD
ncbi:MAG: DUF6580 family putative transport protein, partial [Balneolaceae bacterium]